jgi:hypothetical protein
MIKRNEADYLERYFLWRSKQGRTYLHRLWANDPDDLHCHPWWNISIILKGRYREHFMDGTYLDRKAGDIIFRSAKEFHRLELIDGDEPGSCWTLFIAFKHLKDWGFMTKDGWIRASEYERQHVEVFGRDFTIEGRLFPKMVWLT